MSVAIMGAGISGLACAITLERYGIHPAIFENRCRVGDRFVNAEAMLGLVSRPYENCLAYISEKHKINLNGIGDIKKMVIHSRNEVGEVHGNIGIINIRGRHEQSFENQLVRQVKSEIHYNSKYSYEDLKNTYDDVVLATGDGEYASKLNNYRCDLMITIKGAAVEGHFPPNTTEIWFNDEFVPKGYAFLLPYSDAEANIVMAYPEYPENKELDLESMWQLFFSQVCKDTKQTLRVTDGFTVSQYMLGICKEPVLDNTYFTGNCFGALAPGAGFGQFVSMLTGIYAAQDICGLESYQKQTKPLIKNYENSLVIRRGLEKLDDNGFDACVRHMNDALVGSFLDKAVGGDTRIDWLKLLSFFLRPVIH